MINQQLLNPRSIVVVGGSNECHKPGGAVIRNLIEGNFGGHLYVMNPKETVVQGLKCFQELKDIPQTDLDDP
jgi:acyl-CoA synthetase (NDP forming)